MTWPKRLTRVSTRGQRVPHESEIDTTRLRSSKDIALGREHEPNTCDTHRCQPARRRSINGWTGLARIRQNQGDVFAFRVAVPSPR